MTLLSGWSFPPLSPRCAIMAIDSNCPFSAIDMKWLTGKLPVAHRLSAVRFQVTDDLLHQSLRHQQFRIE